MKDSLRKKEFFEGVNKFLRNEPVFDIEPSSYKPTERNFKSSMKILAIP